MMLEDSISSVKLVNSVNTASIITADHTSKFVVLGPSGI
jgi:hypothetical protein